MEIVTADLMFRIAEEEKSDESEFNNKVTRINFEKLVIEAARNGVTEIVVTTPTTSINKLRKMGFSVRELTRKEQLLESLEASTESSSRLAAAAADRLTFHNKNLKINHEDGLSHRNQLVSVMVTLWKNGSINEDSSIYHFENILKSISNISDEFLLFNRFLLKSILDEIKSMQMAIEQAESIKADHALLPSEADYGLLLRWNDAQLTDQLKEEFSPEILKWYSLHWIDLVKWINESIRNNAYSGLHFLYFYIKKNGAELIFTDPNFSGRLSLNTFPWKTFFRHLSSLGYTIDASIRKYDTIYDHADYDDDTDYDNDIDAAKNLIDLYSDFNMKENDLLEITIGWIGIQAIK